MYLSSSIKCIALVLILVLASCATITNDDKAVDSEFDSTNTNSNLSNNDSSVNKDENGTLVSLPSFTGVDPMANIQINPEIKSTYSKVAKLNKAKKYSEAIILLNNTQKKYPQLSGPDYQKARIYFNQDKLDLALEAVNASLSNNERNYYSLNLKGIVLREQGKFEEASELYLIAIEIYPPYPNSHLNLGVLADIYLRNLPLALLQYKEYMKLTGNKDKKVASWVVELERRIEAGK